MCVCVWGEEKKRNFTHVIFIYLFIFFLIFHRATSDRQSLKIGNKTKSLIYLLRIVPRLYDSPGLIILSHPPGRSLAVSPLTPISLPPSERAKNQDAFLGGSAVLTMLNVIIFFFPMYIQQPKTAIVMYTYAYSNICICVFILFFKAAHRVTDRVVLRAPKSGDRPRTRTDFDRFFVLYIYVCVLLLLFSSHRYFDHRSLWNTKGSNAYRFFIPPGVHNITLLFSIYSNQGLFFKGKVWFFTIELCFVVKTVNTTRRTCHNKTNRYRRV